MSARVLFGKAECEHLAILQQFGGFVLDRLIAAQPHRP